MNIYVANLPSATGEDDLREAFSAFGEVSSANIVRDRSTGASRGFGFVTMPVEEEAQAAVDNLDGTEMEGQAIKVEEARSKPGGDRRMDSERGGRSGPGRRGSARGGSRGREGRRGPNRSGGRSGGSRRDGNRGGRHQRS